MVNYIIVGDEVLAENQELTHSRKVIKVASHHCFTKKLVVSGDPTGEVGVNIPILVQLKTWKDELITTELVQAHITIKGPGEFTPIDLELIEGEGFFIFNSLVPGVFKIGATPSIIGDEGILEVTING